MSREQFLITFCGRSWGDDQVVETFYDELTRLQTSFNFKSISWHHSSLVDLTFYYLLYKNGIPPKDSKQISWSVIKLILPGNTLLVNKRLDNLFHDCARESETALYSTLFYFIERHGKAGFHRIISNSEVEVNNAEQNECGIIGGYPALFYNHFYNQPYSDEHHAEIAKRMLVVGGES